MSIIIFGSIKHGHTGYNTTCFSDVLHIFDFKFGYHLCFHSPGNVVVLISKTQVGGWKCWQVWLADLSLSRQHVPCLNSLQPSIVSAEHYYLQTFSHFVCGGNRAALLDLQTLNWVVTGSLMLPCMGRITKTWFTVCSKWASSAGSWTQIKSFYIAQWTSVQDKQ